MVWSQLLYLAVRLSAFWELPFLLWWYLSLLCFGQFPKVHLWRYLWSGKQTIQQSNYSIIQIPTVLWKVHQKGFIIWATLQKTKFICVTKPYCGIFLHFDIFFCRWTFLMAVTSLSILTTSMDDLVGFYVRRDPNQLSTKIDCLWIKTNEETNGSRSERQIAFFQNL